MKNKIIKNPNKHFITKILFVLIALLIVGFVYQMGKELVRIIISFIFAILKSFS
ncbi:hypothetical protein [Oceanirhabdus sp. W0125-5]|uniref:hypothetical protein n=1 Tax=Oceanirhabdus sp. W0125-5 TaxID=2999116 RepID=UPI0022F2E79D|nr:hypothetical protein [Oceanirhabdus sp. W0125-5]WBW97665.1 hypothetical protein OW730_02485 [Oceanirhabdus sp. W0125-5]